MGLDQQVLAALPELGHGLLMTLLLTLLASLVSVAMGQLGCFLQLRRSWIWRAIGRVYVSLMRGTPAMVQLFVVFLPCLSWASAASQCWRRCWRLV